MLAMDPFVCVMGLTICIFSPSLLALSVVRARGPESFPIEQCFRDNHFVEFGHEDLEEIAIQDRHAGNDVRSLGSLFRVT